VLEAAVNVDGTGLVPSVVLVNAVSTTFEGSGMLIFATLAVLEVDGDELLDSAGAAVLVGTGAVVVMIPVVIGHVDTCGRVPTAVADADDNAPLLQIFADGVGETVSVILDMIVPPLAENDGQWLEVAAKADVIVHVPFAVLVNATSATCKGLDVSANENSQRTATQLPAPDLGWGPSFLQQGQLFIRHAQTGQSISTTSTITLASRITVQELIDRLRPEAVSRWCLLYGGKVLKPDSFIPAHLRERTLDLVGTLLGGSDRGTASAGDALADDADDDDIHMNDDPALDNTSRDNDPLSDDLSDIARVQARRWCQDLLNLGRLHTGVEFIGMLSLLFNLTESQALTLISEHLYGSSLKKESPDELLLGLANYYWEEWSEFLVDSNTPLPTNKAMWKELRLALQEVFSLIVGASSNEPNTTQEDRYDKNAKGLQKPFSPSWHANPSTHPKDTLVFTNLTLATSGPLTRALDNANIPPGVRGTWQTACLFGPDTSDWGGQGTGWAKVMFQLTQATSAHARSIYLNQVPLPIDGQRTQPTIRICRDDQGDHSPKIALEPFNEPSKRKFTFIVALTCLFQLEGGLLRSMTYLHRRDSNWIAVAVLLTSGTGRNLSGLMQKTGFQKSGQLLGSISCFYPGLVVNTQQLLAQHEGAIIDVNFLRSAPKDHQIPTYLTRFLDSLSVSFRVSQQAQATAREIASVAAVALWVNYQSISSNLYSEVTDDSGGNVYMVELLLENCFRSLLRYCAAQQLSAADLEWLLGSIALEVTAPRNEITE